MSQEDSSLIRSLYLSGSIRVEVVDETTIQIKGVGIKVRRKNGALLVSGMVNIKNKQEMEEELDEYKFKLSVVVCKKGVTIHFQETAATCFRDSVNIQLKQNCKFLCERCHWKHLTIGVWKTSIFRVNQEHCSANKVNLSMGHDSSFIGLVVNNEFYLDEGDFTSQVQNVKLKADAIHKKKSSVKTYDVTKEYSEVQQQVDAPSSQQQCVICLSSVPKCCLDPCGHVCYCIACAMEHKKQFIGKAGNNWKCPICRKLVQKYIQVFT